MIENKGPFHFTDFKVFPAKCLRIDVDIRNTILYVLPGGFKGHFLITFITPGCYDEDTECLSVDEIRNKCGIEIMDEIERFFEEDENE